MAFQAYSKTLDFATGAKLQDSASVTASAAGVVNSTAAVFDVGADNAFMKFAIVVDIASVSTGAGQYVDLYIEGSASSAFSTTYRLATRSVGVAGSVGQAVNTSGSNRIVIYGDNVIQTSASLPAESTARYVRVYANINGASTAINYQAWLVPVQ